MRKIKLSLSMISWRLLRDICRVKADKRAILTRRCHELESRTGAQDVPLPKATPRRIPLTPSIRNTPKMVSAEAEGGQVACLRRELEERDAEVAALEAEREKLTEELEERVGAVRLHPEMAASTRKCRQRLMKMQAVVLEKLLEMKHV